VYQRLLAGDEAEASDIVERHVAARPGDAVYDDVLLPSVFLAAGDHARGRIGADERRVVIEAVRDIADEVSPAPTSERPAAARVLGVPARTDADETALAMLGHLLEAAGLQFDTVSTALLAAEVARDAAERGVAVVVIGALPPGGLVQARHLTKRLRGTLPDVKIVVGRWCVREDVEGLREALTGAGADAVGTSLLETRDQVVQLTRATSRERAA
jgi:methylmalonyl-CoA mutase cobalamin-binding subunit